MSGYLSHRGSFVRHILQCFPFELPRPLGPFPLTLTLSRGGEREFCPSLPFWTDVRTQTSGSMVFDGSCCVWGLLNGQRVATISSGSKGCASW